MTTTKGFFITFEGIEGSGKTTQINLLKVHLEKKGASLLLTREPGGTQISDEIRKILLNPDFKKMTPTTELFLYGAARAQHVEQVIGPALKAGKLILCDRYFDATMAYQGYGRGLDLAKLKKLHLLSTDDLYPDLTFLLDASVEVGLKRARQREDQASGPAQDRFEQEELLFHQKVRQGYLSLAQEFSQRYRIIKTENKSAEEIHKEIVEKIPF